MNIKQATKSLVKQKPNWFIVSDLDGTLLDHYSYSHEAVDALLQHLNSINVPVIFNSSKTAAEIVELRQDLHNFHPFIVENGSAIYLPLDYFSEQHLPLSDLSSEAIDGEPYFVMQLGANRAQLLNFLQQDMERNDTPCLSFSNASTAELVAATGLSTEKIQKSRQRYFSEPLLWQGTDEEKTEFTRRAAQAGFNTLQGGRFLHLLGQCDKGRAAQALAVLFEKHSDTKWGLIAAGDSANDVDMLERADIAILIRSPSHELPMLKHPHLIASAGIGPVGWDEAVGGLFN